MGLFNGLLIPRIIGRNTSFALRVSSPAVPRLIDVMAPKTPHPILRHLKLNRSGAAM